MVIPPIVPVVTEYQAIARTCACGHVTKGHLPSEATANGTVTISSNASSLLVYLNSAHHLPYQRLQQVAADLFNLPLSPRRYRQQARGDGWNSLTTSNP